MVNKTGEGEKRILKKVFPGCRPSRAGTDDIPWWTALVLGMLLIGSMMAQTVSVSPILETDPVPNSGDAADDACIWIHPTDPAQSLIIATDKTSGLVVYDLDGHLIQYLAVGEPNNVDLRYNFPLGGDLVALVGVSDRAGKDSLKFYRVDPVTRRLVAASARGLHDGKKTYGFCLYHSPISGRYYAFVTSGKGEIRQWELEDDGQGHVTGQLVRSFKLSSRTEGCVADDVLGYVYFAEEDVGIWKFNAEPDGDTTGVLIDRVFPNGHPHADVEGLTIYYASDSTGYLIASSQGSDEFVVYRREGSNDYVMTFDLVDGNGIDGVKGTDGIDVTNFSLNLTFSRGLFIAQDDGNPGANQNFKLVRWEDIAGAVTPPLTIDPSWDPRLVGLVSQSVELSGPGLQLSLEDGAILLRWQTRREDNTRGFFVKRKVAGADTFRLLAHYRDHPDLAAHPSGGGVYQFRDRSIRPGLTYVYQVGSVSASGAWNIVATQQIRVPSSLDGVGSGTGSTLQLFPASPNPFNPQTWIQFALQRLSPVSLEVFNTAGQQVRTLFRGEPNSLVVTVRWDGRNDRGELLPSGVYLVRLQQGYQFRVRKVLLLK